MRLDRIVIGTDFRASAGAATRWLARYVAPDAELVLVHVVELPQVPGFLRQLLTPHEEAVERAREDAELRLRELAESVAAGTRRIRCEVRVGRAAEQLAAAAMDHQADLIMVGEHQQDRGPGQLLGSTAERLLRSAPTPVLLARQLPAGPPNRILLPIDESDIAITILQWGRLLQLRLGAAATALYIVSLEVPGRMRMVSAVRKAEALEQKVLLDAQQWLQDRLAEAGFPPGTAASHVVIGHAGTEILAAARRFDSTLIILGSHGAGAVGAMLLGSTAHLVMHAAPCPVLVMPRSATR